MSKRFTGQKIRFKKKGLEYEGEIISIPRSASGIYHVGVKHDKVPKRAVGTIHKLKDLWEFFTISEEEITHG